MNQNKSPSPSSQSFGDLSLISSLSHLSEICLSKCLQGKDDPIFDNEPDPKRKNELGQCLSSCCYNYIVLRNDMKSKFMADVEKV